MLPPRLLSISPPDPAGAAAWVARAASLVEAGADGLLLRVPGVAGLPLAGWLDRLMETGAIVVVHARTPGGLALARARHLGLHLPAGALPGLEGLGLVGQSCHSVAELRRAAVGCAYATLSPVFPPLSKPDDARVPVGVEGLACACAAVRLPVLALGGLSPVDAPACLGAGAWGLAGIGALGDPAGVLALAACLVPRAMPGT